MRLEAVLLIPLLQIVLCKGSDYIEKLDVHGLLAAQSPEQENAAAFRLERELVIPAGAAGGNFTGDRRLSCTGIPGCKKYSADCSTCATCSSTYAPASPTKCCKSSSICLAYNPSNCFCTACSDSSRYTVNSKGKCACTPRAGYTLDAITCDVTGCASGYTSIPLSNPKICCKNVTNCSAYNSSTCACAACHTPYLFKSGKCSTTPKPTSGPTSSPTSTDSPTTALPTQTPTVTDSPTDVPTQSPTSTDSPTDAPTALVCPFSCVHVGNRRLQDLLDM